MKNVVVFAKGFLPDHGGVERYSAELAVAYKRAGFRPIVVTQSSSAKSIRRHDGAIVINIPPALSQLLVFLAMFRIYVALLLSRRNKFDFIHATTWKVALPALLVPSAKKIAVTIHGREIFVVPRALKPVLRFVLSNADLIAFVSSPIMRMQKELVGASLKKEIVCWNGVSFPSVTERKHDGAGEKLKILSFNRLVERKNMLRAIEAVASLRNDKGIAVEYKIAGGGPEFEVLKRRVRELGCSDIITLLGRVDDSEIPALYSWADIFLHPQIACEGGLDIEGFGLTIADAMSYGCAVIAGRAGGPSDFIQSGSNGILVDGEQLAEIYEALEVLGSDRALLRKLGQNGQIWVRENLDWSKLVGQVIDNVGLNR